MANELIIIISLALRKGRKKYEISFQCTLIKWLGEENLSFYSLKILKFDVVRRFWFLRQLNVPSVDQFRFRSKITVIQIVEIISIQLEILNFFCFSLETKKRIQSRNPVLWHRRRYTDIFCCCSVIELKSHWDLSLSTVGVSACRIQFTCFVFVVINDWVAPIDVRLLCVCVCLCSICIHATRCDAYGERLLVWITFYMKGFERYKRQRRIQ